MSLYPCLRYTSLLIISTEVEDFKGLHNIFLLRYAILGIIDQTPRKSCITCYHDISLVSGALERMNKINFIQGSISIDMHLLKPR